MEHQVKPDIALICSTCTAPLQTKATTLYCPTGHTFPIEHGLPILIDDEKGVFGQSDFQKGTDTFFIVLHSCGRKIARSLSRKVPVRGLSLGE